jgi:hypothetical protein
MFPKSLLLCIFAAAKIIAIDLECDDSSSPQIELGNHYNFTIPIVSQCTQATVFFANAESYPIPIQSSCSHNNNSNQTFTLQFNTSSPLGSGRLLMLCGNGNETFCQPFTLDKPTESRVTQSLAVISSCSTPAPYTAAAYTPATYTPATYTPATYTPATYTPAYSSEFSSFRIVTGAETAQNTSSRNTFDTSSQNVQTSTNVSLEPTPNQAAQNATAVMTAPVVQTSSTMSSMSPTITQQNITATNNTVLKTANADMSTCTCGM